jgi:hypothetical protein
MEYFTLKNAINLIIVFATMIVIFVVINTILSVYCIELKDGILSTALEVCKSCLTILLGFVFGSKYVKSSDKQ